MLCAYQDIASRIPGEDIVDIFEKILAGSNSVEDLFTNLDKEKILIPIILYLATNVIFLIQE